MRLATRTVLITGAAQGIGKALALGFHHAGANLVLIDVAERELAELTAQIAVEGGQALGMNADVSDAAAIQELRRAAHRRFGGIDAVINNAAIGPERNSPTYFTDKPKFWTTADDLWLACLRVNVFGPQLVAKTFTEDMINRRLGRIINVTTSLDTMYRPGIGAYGPCKAAVEANSRIMAQDVEGTGVTVNVLVPGGPVNTRMVPAECGMSAADLIQPETMLAPLLWLCTHEADMVNGMRIIARKWRPNLPIDKRLEEAGAPIAWPQLGAQSAHPTVVSPRSNAHSGDDRS
jgi:NAD(P)-dependent dehydrogenase (short-subunit alcohol dehydrogenase family)